jgi:hypothetical protein
MYTNNWVIQNFYLKYAMVNNATERGQKKYKEVNKYACNLLYQLLTLC